MEKGINLQAKIHSGSDPAAPDRVKTSLPTAFAQANPGLTLTVKSISAAGADGSATIRVYITGEQDPASDFAALARDALHKAVAALDSQPGSKLAKETGKPSHRVARLRDVQEVEEEDSGDSEAGLVLAPQQPPPATADKPAAPAPAITAPTNAAPPAQAPIQAPSPAPAPDPVQASPPSQPARVAAPQRPWWAFWRKPKS